MNEVKILTKIIKDREQVTIEAINKINKVKDFIFTEEIYQRFFDIINNYVMKYSMIPTLDYLESLFIMDSSYKEEAKILSEIVETETPQDHLMALIKQQLNYNLKYKLLNYFDKSKEEISSISLEEIEHKIREIIEEINNYLQITSTETKKVENLKSEESIAEEKSFLMEKEDSYFISNWGIPLLDEITGGIKKGDTFLGLLGSAKSFKSYLLRFLVYNQIIQNKNGLFISLEMNEKTIKRHLYSLHANNVDRWGWDKPSLTYHKINRKQLTPEEMEFYEDVISDFVNSPQMGELSIIFPTKIYTFDDLKADILEYKNALELKGKTLDYVAIDYLTLIVPTLRRKADVIEVNNMIKALRLFALEEGFVVMTPIQANRAGFNKIIAIKEVENLSLNLADIGSYSEFEKSCTDILYLATNSQMRKANLVKIGSVLHRESAGLPEEGILARINPSTGWFLFEEEETSEEEIVTLVDEIEL